MRILGIESSCDDTSVALLDAKDTGFVVIAEKTASQVDVHKHYGGVVPELAGRMHAEAIGPLIEEVLESQKSIKPDVIAVTAGPGLVTGLLVGVEAARTLSYLWDVPIVAVNHIEGHIHSVFVGQQTTVRFPAICLIVSGGHTELILMKDFGVYELIGKTRDDAAGECFDKVGKLLGFEYPGGPKISQHAENGDSAAIPLPRPMIKSDDFDFSFAGLKTAALYWLRDQSGQQTKDDRLPPLLLIDFCASFEQAIVDVLVAKTIRAAKEYHAQTVILGGGVSANQKLCDMLKNAITQQMPWSVVCSPKSNYATDNGAMIAAAGYHHAKKKEFTAWHDLAVDPNWHVYGGLNPLRSINRPRR